MPQLLKPKALPEKPYEVVELVFGKEWKWKIPTRFGFGIRAKFDKIQSDACFEWLTKTLNESAVNNEIASKRAEEEERERLGYPKSQLMEDSGIGRALASVMQTQLIPDDAQIQKYINKFLWFNNEDVLKQQLDLLLTPLDATPKASSIIDEADAESVGSVFSYFFDVVNPKKEDKSQNKDSGVSEKDSEQANIPEEVS